MSNERVVGIVGTGRLGTGLAQAAAAAGISVRMMDQTTDLARKARDRIGEALARRAAAGKLSDREREETLHRLRVAAALTELTDAEAVIEAVPEDAAVKRAVLAELSRAVSPKTLLATTTATLAIDDLARPLPGADRFLGLHFFHPAEDNPLVELVRGTATSDQTMVSARAICVRLGKTPVKVTDTPGFIANRVRAAWQAEALRLLEQGEAGIAAIDEAVQRCGGFASGPGARLDDAGLDTELRLMEAIWVRLGRPPRLEPPAVLRKLVAAGHLGRATGRGLYDYANSRPTPAYEVPPRSPRPRPASVDELAQALGLPPGRPLWIYARLLAAAIGEAARVADGPALPRDVNLALERGCGWPEGPLATADRVGLDLVRRLLADFAAETGGADAFAPPPLLERLVAEGHLGEQTARGFLYHSL